MTTPCFKLLFGCATADTPLEEICRMSEVRRGFHLRLTSTPANPPAQTTPSANSSKPPTAHSSQRKPAGEWAVHGSPRQPEFDQFDQSERTGEPTPTGCGSKLPDLERHDARATCATPPKWVERTIEDQRVASPRPRASVRLRHPASLTAEGRRWRRHGAMSDGDENQGPWLQML